MSGPVFDPSSFHYSKTCRMNDFETRYVRVPPVHWSQFPRDHLLGEAEWRRWGIQLDSGWRHTGNLPGEPYTLVFMRGIRHTQDVSTPTIHAGRNGPSNATSTATPTTHKRAALTTSAPVRPSRIPRPVPTMPTRPRATPRPTPSLNTPKPVHHDGYPFSTRAATSTRAMTRRSRIPTPCDRVSRIVVTPRRSTPALSPRIDVPLANPNATSGLLRAAKWSLGSPLLNNLKNSLIAAAIQLMKAERSKSAIQNASPPETTTAAALMLTLQLTVAIVLLLRKEIPVPATDPKTKKPPANSSSDDESA